MTKKIIIIGGGPAGYVGAIRAAQLGASVTIIEKDKFGGTCLNRGCIPTKALYKNAELLNTLNKIDSFGISVENIKINVDKMQERKEDIVHQLVSGVEKLLKANKVEVLLGEAVLQDKNKVKFIGEDNKETILEGDNIVIATGSTPAIPPIPMNGEVSDRVMTSEEALNFKTIPESIAIVGGGVIGIEFANIFNSLGSKVTVLEFLPNILGRIDGDITKRLSAMLKKKGISIQTSTKVESIEREAEGLKLNIENKKGKSTVTAEKVLLSTGRLPVIGELNLDCLGIDYDRKGIKTNENYETSISGIYAVGDVNGQCMLAHAASHQAIVAVEHIMGLKPEPIEISNIPSCVFLTPEISTVGISEEEAKNREIEYITSKFLFGANGKALTLGETDGFVKIIARKDNEKIIGVHIMGPHASDLIHEAVLAVSKKMNVDQIKTVVHGHPTLAECFAEAVMGIKNEAIHAVPGRKK